MKTQTLSLLLPVIKRQRQRTKWKFNFESALHVVMVILVGILPAALVSVITLWAISTGDGMYVSAAYWATGFIFLALMVESDGRFGGLLAVSGLSLMALAWLSSNVAPEFGVLAGFLLAGWVAVPTIKKLNLACFSS